MKILLTGANGYIGKRLLPLLLQEGYEVVCCVRDRGRFPSDGIYKDPKVSVYEIDFLQDVALEKIPTGVDVAYYLIHSMSDDAAKFETLEEVSARNFIKLIQHTGARQIVYLGGIANAEKLSRHLASRKRVEEILRSGNVPLTALKAGIIVGSGSSSFEIIRDLTEKLPVMIAPRWVNTRTQPIAIRNVLDYLTGVVLKKETFDQSFDIGGPDIMTYKQMLLEFAKVRGLKRYIITVPVMTPRLSSYWLYFVTATSYKLAVNLVNSMNVEVIATPNSLGELLKVKLLSYAEAVNLAFQKIEQNSVLSSWKDSLVSSYKDNTLISQINVPSHGVFSDMREKVITTSTEQVLDNIWSIGGKRGWYYGNWLWTVRGLLDKMVGGVGLQRGRTNLNMLYSGDTVDFWRVLLADRKTKRLLLYAEMKLPGEAWLEFKIIDREQKNYLQQTATFRPKGLWGRLYWYAVFPFHHFVFDGMADNLIRYKMKAITGKDMPQYNPPVSPDNV